MKTMMADKLTVEIYPNRAEMGAAAARDIKECFARLLKTKDSINVIFAAAPSQNDVLKSLREDTEIEWGRINAYHMDEYIGLSKDAPQGFGNFLRNALFGRVGFASVNYIDPEAKDIEAEAERYSALLLENPTDVVVMGIGENGHIAFNDPGFAFFNDPETVKIVKLDEDGKCRITVTVAKFRTPKTVPNVMAINADEAEEILKSYGYKVDTVTAPHAFIPEGKVIHTMPEAGEPSQNKIMIFKSSGYSD